MRRILERNNPWSQDALNAVPRRDRLEPPVPPTDEELRTFARATRPKSPGPDGIPPYFLAQLPDTTFRKIGDIIRICYAQEDMPTSFMHSQMVCLYKSKGQWQDPHRWRPKAIASSIYRLIMRWVHAKIYPMLVTWLHPHHYGGRRGVSPAHATRSLMDMIDATCDVECLLSFDLYHAFDSPPILIIETLDKLGIPLPLLRIIQSVLQKGTTNLRSTEETGIHTTHGIRQACPVCCLLFVVVFNIALCHLDLAHLSFVAFVDDITVVVPRGQTQRTAETGQSAVGKIRCQLNVTKSEWLPVQEFCSFPSLPTYHPPEPALSIQKQGPIVCYEINTSQKPPPWAQISTSIFKQVDHQMHLGHPITRGLKQATAYDVLLSEVKEQLGEPNAHPIPTLDRVAILSTMVIPRLLYRAECLPLTMEPLQRLNALMKSFVLAVNGLPPGVADKKIYSHRKIGLGVPYLPVVQRTGALDVTHKHPYMTSLRVGASLPLAPRMVYQTAVAHLKPESAPPQRSLDVYFQAKRLLPQR